MAAQSAADVASGFLTASDDEEDEELVPLPLPAWFYPLCWHTEFRVTQRVAMVEEACVLPARPAPHAAFVPG